MELRHLRYFVAIAEERSITRAAERLWIAQPGLSTQIRRLEAELGVKLFQRHTRGVDLTDAGELFLERARAALDAAEAARSTGHSLQAGLGSGSPQRRRRRSRHRCSPPSAGSGRRSTSRSFSPMRARSFATCAMHGWMP